MCFCYIQIDGSESLSTFKAILEAETGLAASAQVLFFQGKVLGSQENDTTLLQLGFHDDDVVTLEQPMTSESRARTSGGGSSGMQAPRMLPDGSAENPQELMALLSQAPGGMERLPPPIRDAILKNNVEEFQKALREMTASRKQAAEEEARFLRLAQEDPLNPEVQAKLEQAIQQKNIAENFENALEYNPEAFATVSMLYVNMEVNSLPMKAFVDSGAQMTIMYGSMQYTPLYYYLI